MNVGLMAHDSKKKLMHNFCVAYRSVLSKHNLYATGTTGRLIEEVTNLNVHKFLAGNLGGDAQLGAQIENNVLDIRGNYVILCISNDSGTVETAINNYIKSENLT